MFICSTFCAGHMWCATFVFSFSVNFNIWILLSICTCGLAISTHMRLLDWGSLFLSLVTRHNCRLWRWAHTTSITPIINLDSKGGQKRIQKFIIFRESNFKDLSLCWFTYCCCKRKPIPSHGWVDFSVAFSKHWVVWALCISGQYIHESVWGLMNCPGQLY